jgi:hypothetical protein
MLRLNPSHEAVAQHILSLLLAVEHMNKVGFVHRNLRPDVIFESDDGNPRLFISGLDYATQTNNKNMNFNIPDNIYRPKLANMRAGDTRQDILALAGIIMAWQSSI